MKVPVYEEQVQPQTTKLSTSQAPGIVAPEAFGGEMAKVFTQAGQDIGKTGQAVNAIFEARAKQQNEVKIADLENQFILDYQNALHNPDPKALKTIKIDGKDYDVPAGLLDRQENQANGSSAEHEQIYQNLRGKYLDQVKDPTYRAKLNQALTGHYTSGREMVIKNEIAQIRKADTRTYESLKENLIDSAGVDPNKIGGILQRIKDTNAEMSVRLGIDVQTTQKANHDDIEKAIWRATDTVLEATGSVEEAKRLLNDPSLKDLIPEDLYEKTETKLEQAAKRKNELIKWNIKQTQTQGAFDLAKGILDGSLDSEQIKAYQQAGMIDTDVAAIFDTVARKINFKIPEDTLKGKPDYFLRLLDKSLDSKTESIKILKDATEAYGKEDMGANQYAYFIQEANKKFEREKNGLFGVDKALELLRDNAHTLNDFSSLLFSNKNKKIEIVGKMLNKLVERVLKGEDPTLAQQNIRRETVVELHPKALTYPEEGQIVIDNGGNLRVILPTGDMKETEQKKENAI